MPVTQAYARSVKRCVEATIQAADRVDLWTRRTVFDHPLRDRPTVKGRSAVSAWMSAIGNGLQAQYDAVATPLPQHIAALVEQLEKK